jgi:trimeric autotransporter adhesin
MKINNLYIVLFNLFVSSICFAQIGIGTTSPNSSSVLDVVSNNKGILIPRVNLLSSTDVATIASPATGLLVYNLNTISDVTPGFYYWNGTWKSTAFSNTNWMTTGNTITTTDYLGSNNFFPIVFKAGGTQIGNFHPNGAIMLGVGSTANVNHSVAIGNNANSSSQVNALALGTSATASGFRSSAIGYGATASNNDGTALGYLANASGYQATAIGTSVTSSNNNSIAIGNSVTASGYLGIGIGSTVTSSNNNTLAIGNGSTASGLNSTAVGNGASATGQNTSAIGYNATTAQSDAIVLGSSTNANNKVGIGTNSPDERLHIAGSIKIVDGTQGLGKILTSDASGKASWATGSAKSYGSAYYNSTGQTLSGTTDIALGGTNASSGVTINADGITVLAAGVYKITYNVSLSKSGAGNVVMGLNLLKNGIILNGSLSNILIGTSERYTIGSTIIVTLAANDKITIRNTAADSNVNVLQNGTSLNVESM